MNDITVVENNFSSIHNEEWFHGHLPRQEAECLLKLDGDYLVRVSSDQVSGDEQHILSVMWSGPKHFIIHGSNQNGWHVQDITYGSIQELVTQIQNSGQSIGKNTGAVLKRAIPKPSWILHHEDIEIILKIGKGQFGDVHKGKYKDKDVAIKACRESLSDSQKKKFLREGRILKGYNHPHIIRFIGIAAEKHPLLIVMEFLEGGSLLNYLIHERAKIPKQLSNKHLTQMCVDIASAMAYLEERQCIHRDLAARNCLLGKENVIKLADFGLSIEFGEVRSTSSQIPVKWTAPEAIKYGTYSSSSDVWSFAVFVWEIFSFGQTPYQGLTKEDTLEKINQGFRLLPPDGIPEPIYNLMLKCWQTDPTYRPRFQQILQELEILQAAWTIE